MYCSAPRKPYRTLFKEVIHSTPVEPLTGPPKIVHPFPEISPQALLPPPPGILANFSVKLNSVAKMHTGPPIQESPAVDHHDNPAQSCAEEAVTRRNLKSHQLSLNQNPPSLKYTKDIQVCSVLLTLFIYKRHIYIYRLSEIFPVPVRPPDDLSKAMDMPRTKCRHGG